MRQPTVDTWRLTAPHIPAGTIIERHWGLPVRHVERIQARAPCRPAAMPVARRDPNGRFRCLSTIQDSVLAPRPLAEAFASVAALRSDWNFQVRSDRSARLKCRLPRALPPNRQNSKI